jgi:hypothetical protein
MSLHIAKLNHAKQLDWYQYQLKMIAVVTGGIVNMMIMTVLTVVKINVTMKTLATTSTPKSLTLLINADQLHVKLAIKI